MQDCAAFSQQGDVRLMLSPPIVSAIDKSNLVVDVQLCGRSATGVIILP